MIFEDDFGTIDKLYKLVWWLDRVRSNQAWKKLEQLLK